MSDVYIRSISKAYDEKRKEETWTVTFKFPAYVHNEFKEKIKKLLRTIEYLGGVGASRVVQVSIDGDGSDQVRVSGYPDIEDKNWKVNTDKDTVEVR